MSSVAKKHSVDRPIRTGSTESVTDWANRTGAIGFSINPEYRGMMGTHRESPTKSCLWVLLYRTVSEYKAQVGGSVLNLYVLVCFNVHVCFMMVILKVLLGTGFGN